MHVSGVLAIMTYIYSNISIQPEHLTTTLRRPGLARQGFPMLTAIDLFSGFGGWTRGVKDAGLNVLWAANHWPAAVEWHTKHNLETHHVCQGLHQADWSRVPKHDVMLAYPCCQGHEG